MTTEHLWVALQFARISPTKIRNVVDAFGGDIEGLFYSPKSHLREVLDEQSVELVSKAAEKLDEALAEWEELRDKGVQLFPFTDHRYPKRLLYVRKSPPILYAWGNTALLNTTGIGICGSRNPSVDGLRYARRFGRFAAQLHLTLISGYAGGTDTEAHLGTLEGKGSTIMVLADGLANFRVKAAFKDFDNLSERVLLLSQFSPTQRWIVGTAMERNKVICGLADGLVIVEAGASGGTLNTGRECLLHGKPLWVIQYQRPKETAAGNEILIQEGALPLHTEKDLYDVMAVLAADKQRTFHNSSLISHGREIKAKK